MTDRKWTLEELRAHLDRKPPQRPSLRGMMFAQWTDWFDWSGDEPKFLGNRSGAVHKEDGDE